MSRIDVAPGVALACEVDDYLWPWDRSTPVVMIHGLVRDAEFWRRWVPYAAAKHRVYRPELRGCGRSTVPPPGTVLESEALIEDLRAVFDALGIARAHLAGESSGGLFGMMFAERYPERVASMVQCYVGTRSAETIRANYSLGEDDGVKAILKLGVEKWCRGTLEQRLDLARAEPELREWVIREMGKTPAHVGADYHRLLRTLPSAPDLVRSLDAPVLLISGDGSALSLEQMRELARERPNVRLHVVEGCGNGVNLIAADECARVAAEFWDWLPAGG